MLRSNGSKRRLAEGVQQSVAADNPSRPGDEHPQDSELATCERDRVAEFADKHAAVEIEDEARETHRQCDLRRRLEAVKFRIVAHER